MAKLTKWEKSELLYLYKQERSDKRCLIIQELDKRAKELTSDLIISIANVQEELDRLTKERVRILKEHNLYEFEGSSQYTCRINTLHKRLINFDKETTHEIQKLITGE